MLVGILIGLIGGMLIGRFFRDPVQDCPAEVLGYDCLNYKGMPCDHRKSELYKAHMHMALAEEKHAEDDNLYTGGK